MQITMQLAQLHFKNNVSLLNYARDKEMITPYLPHWFKCFYILLY